MNCDRIAPWYAAMEYASFGNALLQTRCRYLDDCRSAKRVLLLGEGDGRFLQRLIKINPTATFDYVDGSARMIEVARRKCGERRVNFHQLNPVKDELPSGSYDLIVTHFFLDCLSEEEVQHLVAKIAASNNQALWLISEFAIPAHGWRRLRAQLWVGSLYEAFRILTGLSVRQIPDYPSALASTGFHCTRSHTSNAGLLRSELWQREESSCPIMVDRTEVELMR